MPTTPRSRCLCLALAMMLPVLLLQSGCYKRVVSTRGIGTSAVNTEESYQEAWPIETVGRELQKNDNPRGSERAAQRRKAQQQDNRSGQRIFSSGN